MIFECHHLMETFETAVCTESKFIMSHSQLCPKNHREKEQRPEDAAETPASRVRVAQCLHRRLHQ